MILRWFSLFNLYFLGAGDQSPRLLHAEQMLCHWVTLPLLCSSILFFYVNGMTMLVVFVSVLWTELRATGMLSKNSTPEACPQSIQHWFFFLKVLMWVWNQSPWLISTFAQRSREPGVSRKHRQGYLAVFVSGVELGLLLMTGRCPGPDTQSLSR